MAFRPHNLSSLRSDPSFEDAGRLGRVARILRCGRSALVCLACGLFAILCAAAARADDATARSLLVHAVVSSNVSEQVGLIDKLAETGSDLVPPVLNAWREGGVFIHVTPDGQKVPFLRVDGKATRIDDGTPIDASETTPVDTTAKVRKAMKNALDVLMIAGGDPQSRRAAVIKLGMAQNAAYLPVFQARLAVEKDPSVTAALREAIAITQLTGTDNAAKISAIDYIVKNRVIRSLDLLKKLSGDADPQVAAAATAAVSSMEGYLRWVELWGTLFRGLSLGSILLIAALGLAITFGLMGVINMAHGEIIVVGAYTTYMVQNIFGAGVYLSFFGLNLNIPGFHFGGALYESYFLFAIPISFLVAGLVGIALERGVIRFLYSRPLESLLATWGVSLVLQQLFRLIFGANNVQVYSPSWLSGNFTVSDVLLGWNRLFVIGFAIAIVLLVWLLLTRTSLGLLIRAVMQSRDMAACMGVKTERVNMLTFGLGSGLAGLAGAFLSQLGNVGPGLGQSYIVDCFMTVVVGGVGNLVGTIYSALGIGVVDQALQPFLGPVMGKITVLAAIILFLQWKPGGLFPTRSRSLEG
ncbi:MAG: urea ABC transporter permease subunit UrtB [Terrimicrobiaceae bacterium]